ncbi:MAG: RNA methyltransferase [bacterium]|nr:MAG: RNA methyltransferase [bacterium]
MPPTVSREKLRTIRSLASAKIRRRRELCLVEGERALEEAGRAGLLRYLVLGVGPEGPGAGEGGGPVKADVPVFSLDRGSLDELSGVRSGTGVLGVAQIPPPGRWEDLPASQPGLPLLFLDGLQEPGNVGALIRTAWALGFAGVLLGEGTADPFSAKAVRSSAGAVFHLPLFEGMGLSQMDGLLSAGYTLFLAEAGGEDYRRTRFPARSILALGNEARGFSTWITGLGRSIGVPMAPGADSLNVVVAGGIIAAQMTAAPGRGEGEGG